LIAALSAVIISHNHRINCGYYEPEIAAPEVFHTKKVAGGVPLPRIKSMTIAGYYTTEIGMRRELGDSGQLFQRVSRRDHPEHQG